MSIIRANVAPGTRVMTDEARQYRRLKRDFPDHQTVELSAYEFARGEAHTNTVEGFYSVFKRGMKGVYQHCKEKHLHRYVAEFDFRYNNRTPLGVDDAARTAHALAGIRSKRLMYKDSFFA